MKVKNNQSTARISKTACIILSYLADNPDAEDTLEGIVEWWLLKRNIKQEAASVELALATELIANGLVIKVRGPDSRIFYKLNQEKYNEIQIIIKQMCN